VATAQELSRSAQGLCLVDHPQIRLSIRGLYRDIKGARGPAVRMMAKHAALSISLIIAAVALGLSLLGALWEIYLEDAMILLVQTRASVDQTPRIASQSSMHQWPSGRSG
jgi:hypothetical protein